MLRSLFINLFNDYSIKWNRRQTKKTRPPARIALRAEALEGREVPASLVWTNATGDGMFSTAANWYDLDTQSIALLGPGAGDDIYFDGDVTSASSRGMPTASASPELATASASLLPGGEESSSAPDEYRSVNLIDGYAGTVTTASGFRTQTLLIESGAIFQTSGDLSDIWVSRSFTWTGGTLGGTHADTSNPNFAASNSTLHLLAGSTSTIDPGAGNTIATGDTLSFEAAFGVGSTATFHTGTVNFVGGLGVVIDAFATVNAEVKPATATFENTAQPGASAKMIKIKAGGKMYVKSAVEADGGTFDSAIPVLNYGLFQVEKNATANIRGAIPIGQPQTDPSFYQSDPNAAIKIENGSRLVTERGLSFLGGKIATLAKADAPKRFSQTATIGGKVSLTDGHLYINEGTTPHVFGTLVFENDVWLGGATLHIVIDGRAPGTGDAGKSDLFDFRASLLDGLDQPVLKITTINLPHGGSNQNQTWEFLKAANAIEAPKPTVVSETQGVNFQVLDTDQNHNWWLKPRA